VALRVRTERGATCRLSLVRARAWLGAGIVASALLLPWQHARAQEMNATSAGAAIYVRTDSDHTTVVTPRVRAGAPIADQTRVDLVYTADVWSSASIDIRTSASKVVTEQRDELDVSLQHAFPDLTVGGSYRYSKELDYESHGGALGGTYDFADKNASLGLTARAYFDQVGRAGDPGFARAASTLSARVSFTQVIDPKTFGQVVYEATRQQGYLSSPYRFVRIAMDAGQVPSTCVYPVKMCVLENNPGSRLRHAFALSARRALSAPLSLGASYRFYLDDWAVLSHTASIDAAWVPGEGWLLSLGYRFYHQSAASHYQPFYLPMPMPTHYTSDKELTSLSSHRIELEAARTWPVDTAGTELRTVLVAAPSYYSYDNFLPLGHITAFDVTIAVEVKL
jgi:hypothetical protein